ncbi:oplophorus-luciferin 2-monooxygenase non-catalytic subunit-like [Daphnia carinata]|uniref:oplophorus-luciferin 2-monooxygenase non-catalytic subunit-like n=1 Tax=Daphnia carinata TaxID=120202 RepID=UPI00257FFA2F|nr:oplophorus-luciferin 2-monooxygenase non-catalytic subunit-like [Daphnia carinata]
MKILLVLLALLFCGLGAQGTPRNGRAIACPDSFLITPCVCTLNGQQIDMTCAGLTSLKSLTDIFARTFPTNVLHSIVIQSSTLGPLPNNVFNGKSFEIISFLNNRLTSFDNTGILSSSSSTLRSLTVRQDTDDWTFNFANVQGYNLLTSLELSGYSMVLSGTLSSSSLTSLTLRSDFLAALPPLGSLPALTLLNLDGSVITTLAGNSFASFASLSELYLGHNKIESLTSGLMSLAGSITQVDLSSNLIDTVQPNWITGVSTATSVQLVNNYISVLDQASFEGVIQALMPSGKMLLDGNPLTCGCEVAWVVTNSAYLTVANDARCVNGTRLANLDPNYFLQNC